MLGMITSAAWADPLPAAILNSAGALLNTGVDIKSAAQGNPTYPVNFSFGTGGGFAATIDGYNTTVWCVDAEEYIWLPTTYQADVISLNSIAANAAYVHYGNVTGVYNGTSNTTGWQLDLGADNNALARYRMAAYLVSLYQGFPNGPSPNSTQNKDLQTAIWEITWNHSLTPDLTFGQIQNGVGASDQAIVQNYITQAQAFADNGANAGFFENFAIVSGSVNAAGGLTSPGYQTYVVQLNAVPEPAGWLVLLIGLALIMLRPYRRRAPSPARRL